MHIILLCVWIFRALGQGAFGEVYEGQLFNPADNSYMPVAVKVSGTDVNNY